MKICQEGHSSIPRNLSSDGNQRFRETDVFYLHLTTTYFFLAYIDSVWFSGYELLIAQF